MTNLMYPAGGVDNLLLCADSYKITHHMQYPPETEVVYSYFESRGGKFDETVFFGLQYIIKRWLMGTVITEQKIEEAKEIYKAHFNGHDYFNEEGWKYIVEKHGGRLPVRIRAVPEGTILPTRNVLFTVENTDKNCFWLTNYLETLLVQVWYPMTVATNSYYQKRLIAKYMKKTSESMDELKYKLHDFGYRGSTSVESAGIGGAAHLVNFEGTDTIASLMLLRRYYHSDMAGYSVPAAEHSTVTTWGKTGEREAFKNMLEKFPSGIVSIVSDSYDVYNAVEHIFGEQLHDAILEKAKNGRLVIRPDSGDPLKVILQVLELLEKKFPVTTNSLGYKMLPPYIRILQGDGINYEALGSILEGIMNAKWSIDNMIFGSGGALLQKVDRDTQKCAYKCCFALIDNASVNVFKDPVTDHGKKSKRGRLRLVRENNTFRTEEEVPSGSTLPDALVTVFEDGQLLRDWKLEDIRSLAGADSLFH